ncbi:hypothetical protein C6W92_07695 [Roseovarius sp. A46]|uniref:DUF6778 family protein n=1 Tax=Roseovarius sp. A46 TaxID=2109331 RepID=UPI001012589C|nr:DUF6778 family protein [Roseovarius sp. A46]RXV64286.1 hypothetical protein C6W92_07695 [Roseovarius sp. A46]
MYLVRLIAALMLGLGVSACASVETATRNAPHDAPALRPAAVPLDVQEVRVRVPRSLRVSEANRYLPGGDIVWREDPPGDRHAQVAAILEQGLERGVAALPVGAVPVVLDVELTKFHALSEKARYTFGGVHAIQFTYTLRDPETGVALTEPKFVKADFKALGGQKAIAAERRGITQKVRITGQLAKVIRAELGAGDGYQAQALGLIGALNQL